MTYHRRNPESGRRRLAAGLLLVALLAGCGSPAGTAGPVSRGSVEATPSGVPPVTGLPPADPGLTTRLAVLARSGSAELGSFAATPGDLWVGGRCSGGDLELRLDPVVVIPVPCERLGHLPFLNQVVMRVPTRISMSVVAPVSVTWNLRIEQAGDPD